MIFDYCPEYINEGFVKGFVKNKPYFITILNKDGNIQTIKVFVENVYSESPPGPIINMQDKRRWYVKLFLPHKHKNRFHKFITFGKHKYFLFEKYIEIEFVRETMITSQISFLNIMSDPNVDLKLNIQKAHSFFADKYPDIYFTKMLNYKGLRRSHQPISCLELI